MLRKFVLVSVACFLAVAAVAAPDATHISIAGRDVAVWKPIGDAPKSGFPVVVFSHGFTGCNTQSTFLMEALAQAGYFVLAPNHADARCGTASQPGWHPGKLLESRPAAPFGNADAWSEATYRDRYKDIEAVLDAVLREKSFEGVPVDRQRVGLAGHSLGGYTALGVAGAWPSWKDHRIKAVLALSPYVSPYVAKGNLPHLDVPVMYQGGTLDFGITPTVKRFNGAYDLSSSPKFYVEFDGAGHLAWTNLNKRYQELIDSYSVAFFDRYLKGETDPDPLGPLTGKPAPKGVSYLKLQAN